MFGLNNYGSLSYNDRTGSAAQDPCNPSQALMSFMCPKDQDTIHTETELTFLIMKSGFTSHNPTRPLCSSKAVAMPSGKVATYESLENALQAIPATGISKHRKTLSE